jgi:transposase
MPPLSSYSADPAPAPNPVPVFGPGRRTRRLPYPSDLTDAQWKRVEPLLPPGKPLGRHRSTSMREVVNGINYRWATGCVWRMLPHDFPPWTTVYTWYRQWQHDGTLVQIRQTLFGRSRRRRPASRADHRRESA